MYACCSNVCACVSEGKNNKAATATLLLMVNNDDGTTTHTALLPLFVVSLCVCTFVFESVVAVFVVAFAFACAVLLIARDVISQRCSFKRANANVRSFRNLSLIL